MINEESVIPLKERKRVTGASKLRNDIYNEEFDPGSG